MRASRGKRPFETHSHAQPEHPMAPADCEYVQTAIMHCGPKDWRFDRV